MVPITFTIPLQPITKKNSQRLIYNQRAHRIMVLPSEQYKRYEAECFAFVPTLDEPIAVPVEVTAVFYLETRRKTDITNLMQALLDILVKYGVLADDNYTVVASLDGSRCCYDKEHPRTEVTIKEVINEHD